LKCWIRSSHHHRTSSRGRGRRVMNLIVISKTRGPRSCLRVEAVMGTDGRISQVLYKVCTFVEQQHKLLVVMIDSLWKHTRRRKALCDSMKLKKGEYYYLGQNQHIKNEQIYYTRAGESILDKVVVGFIQDRKKKMVQFPPCFICLSLAAPCMITVPARSCIMLLVSRISLASTGLSQ
jgi:hypothetical protein